MFTNIGEDFKYKEDSGAESDDTLILNINLGYRPELSKFYKPEIVKFNFDKGSSDESENDQISINSSPMSLQPSPQNIPEYSSQLNNDIPEESNSKNLEIISEKYSTDSGKSSKLHNTYERCEKLENGLRDINEIPPKYQHIFAEYPCFNAIQSRVFEEVFYKDSSAVISAPTGSGKTVIFELAIIHLIMKFEALQCCDPFKIIYMAPVKALCFERRNDWQRKFSYLGLNCCEVTGDTTTDDMQLLDNYNILFTTPEKWDSLTRKWRDNRRLVQSVKLFLIDEVHLLTEEKRGPVMEAVVSRMKIIQECFHQESKTVETNNCKTIPLRFIAVSATIPNIEDVAAWLGKTDKPAYFLKIGEDQRPVKLQKVVIGYPFTPGQNQFKFEIMLSYKLRPIIFKYANGKPTLIFCSTRKGVLQTCEVLRQQITFNFGKQQQENLASFASEIKENKLKDFILSGIAYHHAGMDVNDRHCIEESFYTGNLPVLVATSTLALGVNLPAHLVIIKSTQQYAGGMYVDYSESQILQMIGRAGRPQFDDSATAVIMTKDNQKVKYEKFVEGKQLLESRLHHHLIEHINSEVVLHTITEKAVAMNWIRSTFLYVRALKNPRHYGISSSHSYKSIENELHLMCLKELTALANYNLVDMEILDVKPTNSGILMAKYCMKFESMKLFSNIKGTENLKDMLFLIASCEEFVDHQLRTSEKRVLNTLNKTGLRFQIKGPIKTREMKIFCLIQALFGSMAIYDVSLNLEMLRISKTGERTTNCVVQYLMLKTYYTSLLNALILAKCFHCRLWENSLYVSRQLDKIGSVLSELLVATDKTTFEKIASSNPRDLERILNRPPPMGNKLQEAALHLPQYILKMVINLHKVRGCQLRVSLELGNIEFIRIKSTAGIGHTVTILVGDSDNCVLLLRKVKDCELLKEKCMTWILDIKKYPLPNELYGNVISETWVGIDVQTKLKVVSSTVSDSETNNDNMPVKTENPSTQSCRQEKSLRKALHDIKPYIEQINVDFKKYVFTPRNNRTLKKSQTSNNDHTPSDKISTASIKESIENSNFVREDKFLFFKDKLSFLSTCVPKTDEHETVSNQEQIKIKNESIHKKDSTNNYSENTSQTEVNAKSQSKETEHSDSSTKVSDEFPFPIFKNALHFNQVEMGQQTDMPNFSEKQNTTKSFQIAQMSNPEHCHDYKLKNLTHKNLHKSHDDLSYQQIPNNELKFNCTDRSYYNIDQCEHKFDNAKEVYPTEKAALMKASIESLKVCKESQFSFYASESPLLNTCITNNDQQEALSDQNQKEIDHGSIHRKYSSSNYPKQISQTEMNSKTLSKGSELGDFSSINSNEFAAISKPSFPIFRKPLYFTCQKPGDSLNLSEDQNVTLKNSISLRYTDVLPSQNRHKANQPINQNRYTENINNNSSINLSSNKDNCLELVNKPNCATETTIGDSNEWLNSLERKSLNEGKDNKHYYTSKQSTMKNTYEEENNDPLNVQDFVTNKISPTVDIDKNDNSIQKFPFQTGQILKVNFDLGIEDILDRCFPVNDDKNSKEKPEITLNMKMKLKKMKDEKLHNIFRTIHSTAILLENCESKDKNGSDFVTYGDILQANKESNYQQYRHTLLNKSDSRQTTEDEILFGEESIQPFDDEFKDNQIYKEYLLPQQQNATQAYNFQYNCKSKYFSGSHPANNSSCNDNTDYSNLHLKEYSVNDVEDKNLDQILSNEMIKKRKNMSSYDTLNNTNNFKRPKFSSPFNSGYEIHNSQKENSLRYSPHDTCIVSAENKSNNLINSQNYPVIYDTFDLNIENVPKKKQFDNTEFQFSKWTDESQLFFPFKSLTTYS